MDRYALKGGKLPIQLVEQLLLPTHPSDQLDQTYKKASAQAESKLRAWPSTMVSAGVAGLLRASLDPEGFCS